MTRLGIIGYGHMGRSIVGGLARENPDLEVGVVEKDPERLRQAQESDQVAAVRDFTGEIRELAAWANVTVLALKPQDLAAFAESVGSDLTDAAVVSILAGTPMSTICGLLRPARLCRFMPNLAALVGEAAVGISFEAGDSAADPDFRSDAFSVARAIGKPIEVKEELLAALTGVSGSGLAYAFRFIHALALGGTLEGMTYEQALETAIQMVYGAATLLRQNREHPEVMLTRVTSPGGTTIAGVKALEEGAFSDTVMEAVSAASRRAREME
ncbi:MAG: pyrroline-5-carboxylate reductase [Spirochaetaceae bacterium]